MGCSLAPSNDNRATLPSPPHAQDRILSLPLRVFVVIVVVVVVVVWLVGLVWFSLHGIEEIGIFQPRNLVHVV